MSDMAFACVSRVYAGLSARRFDSDVREAQAKGLTGNDPRFNSVLRYFRPLLATTAENFPIRDVTADKAYSGKGNLQAVSDAGGTAYIPFKSNAKGFGVPSIHDASAPLPPASASAWTRIYHMFAYQRNTFLANYHVRSNVETTFSMIKRKFEDSLRSRSDVGQMNEVLCKVVAHNLCVLIASIHELGLDVPAFKEKGQLAG